MDLSKKRPIFLSFFETFFFRKYCHSKSEFFYFIQKDGLLEVPMQKRLRLVYQSYDPRNVQ